ncbi:hypothetical protein [Pyxidicoccus xibeiensis]|uniref:hypothetical protein n=1 Tax=Pyxidicoccus xibeiensis TaxID=2906759 RepID=UPI0020A7F828|nr:hypothetical protein [Pyxidicoccus xibeiensis]MCP3140637.1 hypothetical protein [Pyxidicoccus xibeiensis]
MNEQLRRIQLVTRYYDWLQGLRFLPIGLMLLVMAVFLASLPLEGGRPPRLSLTVLEVGGPVALVLYFVLGWYYRRRFGDVKPSAATLQTRRRMMWTFVLAGLVLSQGVVLALGRKSGEPMPVTLALVLAAGSLVAYWAWMGRFVPHYPPIAGGMLLLAGVHGLGFNPLCTLLHPGSSALDWRCEMATFHAVWGLVIVALSVLDHRLLVRTLRPPHAEEPDAQPPSEPGAPGPEATG